MRATMPRAASSADVERRKQLFFAMSHRISARRLHVTFTVTLARLLVLCPSPKFSRKKKRDCYQSKLHYKALLMSNPINKFHVSWHGFRGVTHTRNVFNTKKKPTLFLSGTRRLVRTVQSSSPVNLMING